jgi:hypothetical protein
LPDQTIIWQSDCVFLSIKADFFAHSEKSQDEVWFLPWINERRKEGTSAAFAKARVAVEAID